MYRKGSIGREGTEPHQLSLFPWFLPEIQIQCKAIAKTLFDKYLCLSKQNDFLDWRQEL